MKASDVMTNEHYYFCKFPIGPDYLLTYHVLFPSFLLCDIVKTKQCSDGFCEFHQSYTEGSSIRGYEVDDIVWFGTKNVEESVKIFMPTAVPMTFGCESLEKGLIEAQFADGILGLSYKEENIITKMFQTGSIPHNAFSMCLTRENGILSIGGTSLLLTNDERSLDETENHNIMYRHLEEMAMVPLSQSHGYYSIQIEDFQIGGIQIKPSKEIFAMFNNGKGSIIDSGTSDTYLPKAIEMEFKKTWRKITSAKYTNGLKRFLYNEFLLLPNITFTLQNNYKWTIEPIQYMEPSDSSSWEVGKTKGFYNRLYVDEPVGAVLGANAMFGHDILFDLANHQIGIAKAVCE